MSVVKFQKVSKIYNPDTLALKDVSFKVKKGEFVSVAGRSGAGKTTLIKLLLAEEEPTSGEVFFEGKNVHKISSQNIPQLRRKIGAIFQDYKLLPLKTTYENVAYPMQVIGAPDKQIERDVPQVLEIVGLGHCKDSFPPELSGGEKQRVAIARALISRPELICADEPTGDLDPYHTRDIIRLLVEINQLGTTVILATHDKEIINRLEKRVVTLDQGRVIRDEPKGRFIV